jgi:hypothetical protein
LWDISVEKAILQGLRKEMKKIILCLLVLSLQPSYARSPQKSDVNFSPGIGTPITTSTTGTLPKHAWSVNQRTEYYRSALLSDLTLIAFPEAENLDDQLLNYLSFGYGLFKDFSIGAVVPYSYTRNYRSFDPEVGKILSLGNISGITDTSIYALWRLNNEKDNKLRLETALFFGTNAPTGVTSRRTQQGVLFSASDQPGTGAWNPFFGIFFTKLSGNLALNLNLVYTRTTKGTQDTLLGSYFDYNFAAVYNFRRTTDYSLNAIFEITGGYLNASKTHGIKSENSGWNSVYWQPGLRLNVGKRFSAYFGAGLPLTESLNGVQAKSGYLLLSGIDITFQ